MAIFICLSVLCSFVRLSPETRGRVAAATNGVTDVSPWIEEFFRPREIYASGGSLPVVLLMRFYRCSSKTCAGCRTWMPFSHQSTTAHQTTSDTGRRKDLRCPI